LRFPDGNDVVVGAVENPHRNFADSGRCFRVALRSVCRVPFGKVRVSFKRGGCRMNAATDDNEGSIPAWIFFGQMPTAVSTHGNSREISSLRITVKFPGDV